MDPEENATDDPTLGGATLVRRYYDALDEHNYDALENALTADFVQHRPDRSFDSREEFIEFMRKKRPEADTNHELESIVASDAQVAVRGRVTEDEVTIFEFADFFEITAGRLARLETYSR
ncbi:nuclear transport factor 2 family protein [Natrinema halophilum]|uniref:Nuclear transport factor 2 family protein n=1 Tax=Natrinema halophilum TaxID=1699371 RepID=A0A7D5KCQ5_9EURY|nr:nuclear transport factor 2 family protein [Natrinema halophilum]QLG48841.1 nuclear transport factor 2 family protein [Natrinema halophilum]